FDGKATSIFGRMSHDGGGSWEERELASTAQASDYPHLLSTPKGIVLAWRTQTDGMRIVPLPAGKTP
ncbi:MAG TPA: hypothetical protein VF637_05940, partial [Sphingomicrobium sp.]